jgi:hypothetical protein
MKNARALTGVIALCTWTAVVAAQAQPSTQMPTPNAANNKVTVQGCLERSPASGAQSAIPGSVGTSGTAASYVLTSTSKSPATGGMPADRAPAPTPAPSAGAASASMPLSYRLDADDSKLSAHVGHKVEITGLVEEQTASGSPSGASAPIPSSMNTPKLKVQDVKMIASSCMAN